MLWGVYISCGTGANVLNYIVVNLFAVFIVRFILLIIVTVYNCTVLHHIVLLLYCIVVL